MIRARRRTRRNISKIQPMIRRRLCPSEAQMTPNLLREVDDPTDAEAMEGPEETKIGERETTNESGEERKLSGIEIRGNWQGKIRRGRRRKRFMSRTRLMYPNLSLQVAMILNQIGLGFHPKLSSEAC